MNEIDEIKALLHNNDIDTAINKLNNIIASDNSNDEAYFLLGNAYCKKSNWQQAINAYCQAININPESPAKLAYDRVNEILDFYNRDIYNP